MRLLLSQQVVVLIVGQLLHMLIARIVILFSRGSKESLEVLATACSAVLAVVGLTADRVHFELALDPRLQAVPLNLSN